MVTVSFAAMDQWFDIGDSANVAFSSYGGATYAYYTIGGHKWQFTGTDLTDDGTAPTGGTVTTMDLDLDDDFQSSAGEIRITGLSVDATGLALGLGPDEHDVFWRTVLSENDVLDFTMIDYSVGLTFGGDGSSLDGAVLFFGGDDSFNDGGSPLTAGTLIGDYVNANSHSTAVGGDDSFTVGARALVGDFSSVSGEGIGGDDTIAPARLGDVAIAADILLVGDAIFVSGGLTGGDDFIDLRLTDLSALVTTVISAVGDVSEVLGGSVVCGNDTIQGSSRGDFIDGDVSFPVGAVTGGDDLLFGLAGDDLVNGGGGLDSLDGGDGDDLLAGGDGDDWLAPGAGDDTLDGGAGVDVADLSQLSGPIFVDLETLMNPDGTPINLAGIENVIGGSGADTIIGSAGANAVTTGDGTDLISGGGGSDYLVGAGDSDTLNGGTGFDFVDGGAGDDNLKGGSVADTILGGVGNDLLVGGGGLDVLDGGAGNDILRGNQGADNLNGSLGDDAMAGRGGADTLFGHAGDDVLTGKGGADTYIFAAGSEADTIRSFTAGAGGGDIIEFQLGAAFDSFMEVMAVASDDGVSTTFDFGNGDILIVKGVVVAAFDSGDFGFI